MSNFLYEDIEDILSELKTKKAGLSDSEALNRINKYGLNVIEQKKQFNILTAIMGQLTDLLAILLLVAALISFLIGSVSDAIIIILIVLVNAVIGFFQEYKAEKAIEALAKYVPSNTNVIRDGASKIIASKYLVPGDIVQLSEGMKIPADIRLIESYDLFTNDASITGESEPQEKKALKIEKVSVNLNDLTSSCLMGTSVVSGRGIGVVIATAMQTQFGKIAKATSSQRRSVSPLEVETGRIAKTVARATFWVVLVLVGLFTLANGKFLFQESFQFAIGVAAALVPQGLPSTVTIALAIAVQRMAKRMAAVRRLSAVETSGEASVIVTDKTGTLTKNEMTLKELYFSHQNYHIKGIGYNTIGKFIKEGRACNDKDLKELQPLLFAMSIANNSEVNDKNRQTTQVSGDSTDIALLIAAEKAGLNTEILNHSYTLLEEIPFNSERKYMVRSIKKDGKGFIYAKGSPQVLIKKCNRIYVSGKIRAITNHDIKEIKNKVDQMSEDALRVLLIAGKNIDHNKIDKNLVFYGLAGIIDPPREDVSETIHIAKKAGIKIIMVTGDYGITAAAIAQRISLNNNPKIITGDDLNEMSDLDLRNILSEPEPLFSRVDPIHKLRIVSQLQKMGHIVSVTGDGVNDAPALKKSDIGVAMGITGTDVAKESAEIIVLNDSFSSIVWAIKEGRKTYENIKKVTKYIFTSNIAEFTVVIIGLFSGFQLITPIQILLIDLGSEIFPAMGLAGDDETDDLMSKKPRDKKDILFGKNVITYILRSGIFMGILAALGFFVFSFSNGWRPGAESTNRMWYAQATTLTYLCIAFGQYINAFSVRSEEKPIWKLMNNKRLLFSIFISVIFVTSIIFIPGLNNFTNMAPIPSYAYSIILFATIAIAIYLEVAKRIYQPKNRITDVLARDIVKSELH